MLSFSIRTIPALPRCPPGSWDLTNRGNRSSRPQRTCRQSSAPVGRSYCRHSGSWVSSSSYNLGEVAVRIILRRGEGRLTSPVHPALTLLTVPEEPVHKLEEIFIFLLQLNILLREASSFTALTQHQEDGADEQGRALKYFLSTWSNIFSCDLTFITARASESEAGSGQPSARESETLLVSRQELWHNNY